jgi:hypothetical protein
MGRARFYTTSAGDPLAYSKAPAGIRRERNRRIFFCYIGGATREWIAQRYDLTVEQVQNAIHSQAIMLYKAADRWRLAEANCRRLRMDLMMERYGKEYRDRPIETLKPPAIWLKWFKQVGITTVNQLRAVEADQLFMERGFPMRALEWAILALDKLGYSYVLKRPRYEVDGRVCRLCGQKRKNL